MTKFLIASHGKMADGVKDTAIMLTGKADHMWQPVIKLRRQYIQKKRRNFSHE